MSTLIEELEQATRDYQSQSRAMARTGMINEARDATRFADRLGARIERIRTREAFLLAECQLGSEPAAIALIEHRALTGPISD